MTEQSHFKSFFIHFWKVWLIALVVGLVAGYIFTLQLKPTYESSTSFVIIREPETTPGNYYRYDGYYSGQAAALARTNFVSWIKSPRTVSEVYKMAGMEEATRRSAKDIGKLITVADITENVLQATVDVSMGTKESAKSKQLIDTLIAYASNNYKPTGFTIQSADPVILTVPPPVNLIIAASGLTFFLASFIVTLLMHYFSVDAK